MKKRIQEIGKLLDRAQLDSIVGGNEMLVPEMPVYADSPYPRDRYGRECRPPFKVNAKGRCTL